MAARALVTRHRVVAAPVPVERIIKAEGIAIRFAPLADDMSGMAFVRDGQKVIVVNALHHPNRQRFTLAHECGHHVLDADLLLSGVHVDKVVLHRDQKASEGKVDIEVRANQFASELLMPDALIRPIAAGLLDLNDEMRLLNVAKRFKVSLVALQYRLLHFEIRG